MTNSERIRKMTDEELAKLFISYGDVGWVCSLYGESIESEEEIPLHVAMDNAVKWLNQESD